MKILRIIVKAVIEGFAMNTENMKEDLTYLDVIEQ